MKKIFLFFFGALLFQSCHVGRFFIYNFADIRDYKKFPSKKLEASASPFHFIEATNTNNLHLPEKIWRKGKEKPFITAVKKSGTVGLIIIRNDSVLYEWFRDGYSNSRIHPAFSMTKTFLSALIGIAVSEGKIKSVEDPITNYIPQLNKPGFEKIRIRHLLDMQSGIHFTENYFNPFGDIAKYYYGTDLKRYIKKLRVEEEPGTRFRYISVNSQLLALILENATGKTPTDYLQEKLWTPLGMEYDGSWNVDGKKNKTEKGFCCINGRAKDFAKLGRLYLRKGDWNGVQILPSSWIDQSVKFQTPKNNLIYSYQWWHTRQLISTSDSSSLTEPHIRAHPKKENQFPSYFYPSGDYYAQGFLGQYIYVYPRTNMIIIRIGKREGGIFWANLFRTIGEMN
jgi:CubicO group peptidase (beta-lactamase class C family)